MKARSAQNVARREKQECVYNFGTRSVGHVACTGGKNCTLFWSRRYRERSTYGRKKIHYFGEEGVENVARTGGKNCTLFWSRGYRERSTYGRKKLYIILGQEV